MERRSQLICPLKRTCGGVGQAGGLGQASQLSFRKGPAGSVKAQDRWELEYFGKLTVEAGADSEPRGFSQKRIQTFGCLSRLN